MKKVVVASREEALKLIGEGVNSMLIFSVEAPHGYKKDGTPAAPRGRKPLSDEVKAARLAKAEAAAAKAAESGKVRVKTGPLTRTAEAPFGVKKDGTPMLKRGRPTKDVAVARKAAATAEREARRALREEEKAARKAARVKAKVEKVAETAAVATAPVEVTEAANVELPEVPVVEVVLPVRAPALEVSEFKEGMKVRLREVVCAGANSLGLQGTITKVDENYAHIQWSNGDTEYRSKEVIEVIAE